MKKYFISLLLIVIFIQLKCMGQYPLQKAYQKKDSVHHKLVEVEGHPKPVGVETNSIQLETIQFSVFDEPNYVSRIIHERGDTTYEIEGDSLTAIKLLFRTWDESIKRQQTFDSAKYYWKKQIYWENKMNAELNRLNRTGHANDISKALVRYQDSAIHYKILLDRLKK